MNVHTSQHAKADSTHRGCYQPEIAQTTYFSLFSGIGGFELGIERAMGAQRTDPLSASSQPQVQQRRERSPAEAGRSVLSAGLRQWRAVCAGFSEIDKHAAQVYRRHYPDHRAYGDVTKISAQALPDFELLCGGFPCQAFSVAGKRRGFADTRGTLFFEIARLAAAKGPRLLLLENVKGLLSHGEGRTFYTIIETLDALGYDLQWQVLNSKDFGIAQNRERVFIVGHLRGTPRPEVFPFTGSDTEPPQLRFEKGQIAHARRSKQGGPDVDDDYIQEGTTIRRLTPIECERLQGFPDGWTEGISDTQRYKCLGNAVTVNVIEAVAMRLFA